jgi:hypothetical protein
MKRSKRKLELRTETIRILTSLDHVHGGAPNLSDKNPTVCKTKEVSCTPGCKPSAYPCDSQDGTC